MSKSLFNKNEIIIQEGTILSLLRKMNIKENIDENNVVMYILVNTDLKMGKGKIISQTAHSITKIIRIMEKTTFKGKTDVNYSKWLNSGETTVVLKATTVELDKLIYNHDYSLNKNFDIWCISTIDEGITQIAHNSLTSIAFRPIMKKNCPEGVIKLKLL